MKTLIRLIRNIVIIFVILIVGIVLGRNILVKGAVENGVKVVTGMPLSMGKLDLNLSNTLVDIENLVVRNPSGFHETSLVEIPKILVDYNLSDVFKGKVHLEALEFDMKQFTVVKNEKGQLNLDSLKAVQSQKQAPKEAPKPAPQEKGKAMPIQIDHFRLKIGKVSYVDYSSGQPVTKDFLINLDESYENITDPAKLVNLIVVKAMMSTTIANLTNFDLGSLQGSVSGVLASGKDMANAAASKGLEALKSTTGSAGQMAGQAGDALKGTTGAVSDTTKSVTSSVTNAASSLKNKLKLPFGKSE